MHHQMDYFANQYFPLFYPQNSPIHYQAYPSYPYQLENDYQIYNAIPPQPIHDLQNSPNHLFQNSFINQASLNCAYWGYPPVNQQYPLLYNQIPQQQRIQATQNEQNQQEPQMTIKEQVLSEEVKTEVKSEVPAASRKQKPHKTHRRNNQSYYWGPDENRRYYEFIKTHLRLFQLGLSEKKNLRINVMMSKKVKTRNSQQCHSHHQKMMKKYGTLENLLVSMTFTRQLRGKVVKKAKVLKELKVQDQINKSEEVQSAFVQ